MSFHIPMVLWVQVCCLIAAMAFMFGHKFAVLSFKLAFLLFLMCLLISLVCGLGSIILSVFNVMTLTVGSKIIAGLIAIAPFIAIVGVVGAQGFKVPRIHNITTNIEHPPLFKFATSLREEGENSLNPLQGEDKTKHTLHYGGIKPIFTSASPDTAFEHAVQVAQSLGWNIIERDEVSLHFEAVDETAFFGFKDDIAVRVVAASQGSQIDLRSVSRVGKSDLGANAARIRAFANAFKSPL